MRPPHFQVNPKEIPNLLLSSTYFKAGPTLIERPVIKRYLNPWSRPRAPKSYFPARGPFKTGRGHVYMHLGLFLHRICMWKWVKPLHQLYHPNVWFSFYFLGGVLLPAHRGEHIFKKDTQRENLPITIIWFTPDTCFCGEPLIKLQSTKVIA